MLELRLMQTKRPELAYIATTVAALAATLITALWSSTGNATVAAAARSAPAGNASTAASCTSCHGVTSKHRERSMPRLAGVRPHPVLSAIEIQLAGRHDAKDMQVQVQPGRSASP